MKNMKKILALLVAVLMIVASVSAFAASTATETGAGSLTVQSSTKTVSVEGRIFRAYKILSVASHAEDYSTIAYTVPSNMVPFFTDNTASGLALNLEGVNKTAPSAKLDNLVAAKLSTMQNDDANITAFAEAARTWCANHNIPYYEAKGAEKATSVVFENLPLGYYIVDDTTDPTTVTGGDHVSAVILDTTTPNARITVKATLTTSDKSITGIKTGEEGEDNVQNRQLLKQKADGKWEVSDVSFGDILHYQVDSIVPDVRGYNVYKFVANDTLAKGLKLDKSTIKLTIGTGTDAVEYTVANGGLEVTTNPETPTGEAATTLKIVLKSALAKFTDKKEQPIAITYDAELTDDALIGAANENDVYIDYSNNPKHDYNGDKDDFDNEEPKGTTPHKKTKTYVTEITIKKVDENGNPLKDAEFTLTGKSAHIVVTTEDKFVKVGADEPKGAYWKLNDGTYTTQDPDTKKEDNETEYKYDRSLYENVSETYNLVRDETTAHTTDENSAKKVVKTTGETGVITFTGLSEGIYTITETKVPEGYNGIDPITVTITFKENTGSDKETKPFIFEAEGADADGDNTFTVTVQNNKGTELPSTGGMGTTILYVGGSILVILAAILLITKRRMNAND